MKQIQKESIEHYDRMIEWAKTQPADKKVSGIIMRVGIGENWYGGDCSYCIRYRNGINCVNCNLDGGGGFFNCCNGLWHKMDSSPTWKQWLYWAYRVRAYIKRMG